VSPLQKNKHLIIFMKKKYENREINMNTWRAEKQIQWNIQDPFYCKE